MRSLFHLDPTIHFLNHGSYGACPKPVFKAYQNWQLRLEQQPVRFLGREMPRLDREARFPLGKYLHTDPSNLVFIPNATHGVNIVARSLRLEAGDEILSTDHEYGACDYTWEFICKKTGALYRHQPISLPANSSEEMEAEFWKGVSPRTKLIFLSHITSPTALHLPIESICMKARLKGIPTLIDGAHAPGQIPVDLDNLGATWYVGNLHKWALSPKGAGFLYTRPEAQNMIEPLVVSWGYHATKESSGGSQFQDYLGWTGTKDPSAFLSVPTALEFMKKYHWEQVQANCHSILQQTIEQICDLVQMEPLYPTYSNLYHQMGIAPLPGNIDTSALKARLYDEFKVEVPLIEWQGKKFVRVSIQVYNTSEDVEVLIDGLRTLLPKVTL